MPHILRRILATADMAYHARGQGQYPFKPLAQIVADQNRRLRRMVNHAYRTVPYYRETMHRLGLRPTDLLTAEDLSKLPILRREQVHRDPEYYVSTAEPLSDYVRLDSSGTTAWMCPFYHDARSLCRNRAYGARARDVSSSLVGRPWGYRQTRIISPGGSVARVERFLEQHTLLPSRIRLQRQLLSTYDTPQQIIDGINAFKPDMVWSVGGSLDQVFRHLRTTGQNLHLPKAIVYGSDHLSTPAGRVIQEEYGIPVFGGFGAVEAPSIGFECERHTGFHINIDLCDLRIADQDGRTLADGESGHIVISNLLNRGTVLLNYQLGDMAVWDRNACPCGRTLPRLVELQGRSEDFIELGSGERLHPYVVYDIFRNEAEVWEWQLVQESLKRVRVSVVPADDCHREDLEQRITAALADVLGSAVRVDVCFVDAVPRTAAGKVRAVIGLAAKRAMRQRDRAHAGNGLAPSQEIS